LLGVDFNTETEFPPDDAGEGFDNIADVLTLSPMLMEKYLDAAKRVVELAVPVVSGVPVEQEIPGRRFQRDSGISGPEDTGALALSYYESASAWTSIDVVHTGRYQVILDLSASERYVDGQFDYNKCRLTFTVDGEDLLQQEFAREGGRPFRFEFDRDWHSGRHEFRLELEPLTPEVRQVRSLSLRIHSITLRGPMAREHWVRPEGYERVFTREVPEGLEERPDYAAELLERFAQVVGRDMAT
jgi:hypothetical protein